MNQEKTLTFQSDTFELTEAIVKGNKKYYVEGFISTTDEDLQGEVVTEAAQDDMVSQLKGREITMDLEHEEWYDGDKQLNNPKNTLIPVAKIVKAERRTTPKNGTYVKAELNSNLGGKFKAIWGSIKDGFLKAFSIAFFPVEAITKSINGRLKTYISKLNLVNVTLTGSPVNTSATFIPVMKSILKDFKEGNEMNEDKPAEETPAEDVKPEVKEEVKEEIKEEVPVEKEPEPVPEPKVEDKPVEKETVKEKPKEEIKEEAAVESVPEPVKPVEVKKVEPLDLIKSFDKKEKVLNDKIKTQDNQIKSLNTEVTKLKALLNKPIIKATLEETPKLQAELKAKGPLDSIA